MVKFLRISALAIGGLVMFVGAGLIFHYYVRLQLLTDKPVVVVPGKWVWVECNTMPFEASIEKIGTYGIVMSETAGTHKGLPYPAVGVVALGESRYFFPFRTVLGLDVDGHRAWSNPYPM